MPRQFGSTWWGQAWLDALEHRAELDPNRLPRGRTYARQDRVARMEVEPGRITALVRGSRALPYRVTIAVPTYDDKAWERVATVVAGRAAHAAALLDGALEPTILADAREAGVDLLPGAGDLRPQCSCPDWADPCKHASAVCYLVADAMDADPFVLFRMRGRTRDQFLESVRAARRQAGSGPRSDRTAGRRVSPAFGGGTVVDPGMTAREAWSRPIPSAPPRREPPRAPGTPAAWPAAPPANAPFSAAGLTELATDAARRAWAQLTEGESSFLELDATEDLARRAGARVTRLDSLLELARIAGVPAAQLTHQAVVWRHAGAEGLAAVDEPLWRPSRSVVEQGRAAFTEVGVDADAIGVRSNRLTVGDVQLRVTADGRWWRYERRGRTWELVEPPADRPEDLLSS
ncbi:MAG: SWIM zinc finger family protein [Acidimicrobiales bacterium]